MLALIQSVLLWTTLVGVVVWATISGGESIRKASFVYRKKAGAVDSAECSANFSCSMQKEFCAAFYIGKDFYLTTAHCLVANSGTISDPNRLDIVGVGIVSVTLTLHKNYSQSNGVDIAWIAVHDPMLRSDILEVMQSRPVKCFRYELEFIDAISKDLHSGFRWVQQPEEAHPTSGDLKPLRQGVSTFEFPRELNQTGLEHVLLCNSKERLDQFDLSFLAYGRMGKYSFDTDCQRVLCGAVKPDNMYSLRKANLTSVVKRPPIARKSRSLDTVDTSMVPDENSFNVGYTVSSSMNAALSEAVSDSSIPITVSNSTQVKDNSSLMNMSVLSDAFQDSLVAESSEKVFHNPQIPEEANEEKLLEASNLNTVYSSIPPNLIPISGQVDPNLEQLGQSGKRCKTPMLTMTTARPPYPVIESPPTETGQLPKNQSCGPTIQMSPFSGPSGEHLDQKEAEMELRRRKAVQKILIHLWRSRNEATPSGMTDSAMLVLVAIGLALFMIVV